MPYLQHGLNLLHRFPGTPRQIAYFVGDHGEAATDGTRCCRICCADGRIKEVCETGVGVYSASGEVLGVEGAIFEVAD